MTGWRVLITGISDPLGRAIAERMATRSNVDTVVGTSRSPGSAASVPGIDVVDLSRDYTGIVDLLQSRRVDTIIHADRTWSQTGSGPDGTCDHVIATMQLAAAAAHREATVRRVVMVSSTRVYPASARAPLHHSESEPLQPRRASLAAALVEAENFVRDLATANPNLSVSILRLAELAGPGTHDPLARLLASPVAPAVWGFDPRMQLLHVDDAVAAVEHATNLDLAGVYNVAADGLVRWRRAARLAHTPLIEFPVTPSTVLTTLLALVVPAQRGRRHPRRVALRPACRNRCLCSLGLPAEQDLRTVRSSLTRPWFAARTKLRVAPVDPHETPADDEVGVAARPHVDSDLHVAL